MNQKALLLIGITLASVFGYPVLLNGFRANPVPISVMTLIVFIGLVAIIIVWKQDPPA